MEIIRIWGVNDGFKVKVSEVYLRVVRYVLCALDKKTGLKICS